MDSSPPPSMTPRSRRGDEDPAARIAELERALRRATADATAAKEEAYALRKKVVRLEAEVLQLRSSGDRTSSPRISGDRISRPTPRPSGVRPAAPEGADEAPESIPSSRLPIPRVR